MAAKKSASRKSAARKASKTPKSRPAAKKAPKTRKPPAAAKKAAAPPKKPAAAKKPVARPKTKAAGTTRAKASAPLKPVVAPPRAAEMPPTLAELDDRIAIARGNLRDLVEQATSFSGAADEERMSQRIDEQEAKLQLLRKQRKELYPEEL